MGTAKQPIFDQAQQTVDLGQNLLNDPAIADALATLQALLALKGGPYGEIAALTVAAANAGTQYAAPGREHDAELLQISTLRSIHATHLLRARTLH